MPSTWICVSVALMVVGSLILLTYYGVLTPETSISAFLCFIGALLITYRRDVLGAIWGSLVVALGIAVFVGFCAGVVVGGASFLIAWGLLMLLSRCLMHERNNALLR